MLTIEPLIFTVAVDFMSAPPLAFIVNFALALAETPFPLNAISPPEAEVVTPLVAVILILSLLSIVILFLLLIIIAHLVIDH